MWLVVIFCMLIGLIIGFQLPIFIPLVYANICRSPYCDAGLGFGGIRAYMENVFDTTVLSAGL